MDEPSCRDNAVDLLDAGTIDIAVGVAPTRTEGRIMSRALFEDEFVTVVRRDHPAARKGMSITTFLELKHVLFSPEGDRHGLVDQALAERGRQRVIGMTLQHPFAAPAVVAQTDMTATLLRRLVLNSPARRHLILFPPPVPLPRIAFFLLWHRRNDAHPAQQWFRDLTTRVAASL